MTPSSLLVDFPFTATDTPSLRARIEADLRQIVEGVRAADPAARAVILTGGFARGEGSAWGEAPLNDYDLVVVRASPLPRPRLYAKLTHRLEEKLGLHVDLLPVWQGRLARVEPKIFWYETRGWGRVLWGPPDLLITALPPMRAEELPLEEGVRLLYNRAAGLLLAYPGPGKPFEPQLTLIQASKACLAAGEALLVSEGKYNGSLQERLRRLQLLAQEGNGEAQRLLPHVQWATRFKLAPETTAATTDPARAWADARQALLGTLVHVLAKAGYRDPEDYGARAPAYVTDAFVYATRSLRAGAWSFHRRPSLAARCLTHRLLLAADPLLATETVLTEAARSAWFGPGTAPTSWPPLKEAYFRLRARTLQ